jgi:hypothetical protein
MKSVRILTAALSCAILTTALAAQEGRKVEPQPARLNASDAGWGQFFAAQAAAPAPAATAAPGAPAAAAASRPAAAGGGQNNNLIPYPTGPYMPVGYNMELPYQIGAQVLAEAYPSPKHIVDVGSYQGQFLQAFMAKFPAARGQWTEPVTGNENNAKRKLGRFGDRIDYVIGCPGRDMAMGCLPDDVDVIITAWVSHHQPIKEITRIYGVAHDKLPANGWFIVLDHITSSPDWEHRYGQARWYFDPETEGNPMEKEVRDVPHPTLEQELAAFKTAGFTDVDVVWKSFDTVLYMAHKN